MIEDCNFKFIVKRDSLFLGFEMKGDKKCSLTDSSCDGEENCIIYQIYKNVVGENPKVKSR